MKIALFGATGGTGRQIIAQATAAGHEIQALVRDPARLPHINGVTVVKGDVLDATAVDDTVRGVDAVIISLGNTAGNPDYVVSRGTAVILDAMQRAGLRRVIAITSIGVGDSKDQVPLFFKALMTTALRKPMEDKEQQETAIMASGLDWIIVRPGGLTDGPATGHYRAGVDKAIRAGQVSRADVAGFVLKQLTDDTYLRQAPAIT